MCSVLIFIKPDNDHTDPSLDWQKHKAGDVIDIHEKDNHFWGEAIEGKDALGWWRVVKVPKAHALSVVSLMSRGPMPYLSLVEPSRTTTPHAIRVYGVDIDALKEVMTVDELHAASFQRVQLPNQELRGGLRLA